MPVSPISPAVTKLLKRFGPGWSGFLPPVLLGVTAAAFEAIALSLAVPAAKGLLAPSAEGPRSTAVEAVVLLLPGGWIGDRGWPAILLACVFVSAQAKLLLWYASTKSTARICRAFSDRLRGALLSASFSLESSELQRLNKGQVQSTVIDAPESFANQILAGQDMLVNALVLVVYLFLMAGISWQLTSVVVLALPFLQVTVRSLARTIRETSRVQRAAQSDLAGRVSDLLANHMAISVSASAEAESARFALGSSQASRASLALDSTTGFVRMTQESLFLGLLAGMLIAARAVHGTLTTAAPSMLVYIYLLRRAATSLNVIARFSTLLAAAHGPAAEAVDLLERGERAGRPDGPADFPGLRQAIDVRGLTFAYPGRAPILDQLSLKLPKGTTTALVGSSGAGKSTFINLLVGLIPPPPGTVLIDGVDILSLRTASWRRRLGLISQEAPLFDASLKWNIAYPDADADDARVLAAASQARLEGVIARLPRGLEGSVGDRGFALSGGERQRVSLARAFYHDAEFIVLDEATSSLDPATEASVQTTLGEILKGRTAVVVAHRPSTIRRSDRIAVLEGGKIVELGEWDELVRRNGAFSRLMDSSKPA